MLTSDTTPDVDEAFNDVFTLSERPYTARPRAYHVACPSLTSPTTGGWKPWNQVLDALWLCNMCGKPTLKPNVVFFGEPVSYGDTATEAIVGCDLLLVLGSSLNVSPASYLPYCTNAPMVAVNQGQLFLDPGPNRYHLECDLYALFHIIALELSLINIYGNFVAPRATQNPSIH